MPRTNGLVFLEKIMRPHPMPVVMVSTPTAEQREVALRALSLGALDCIFLKRFQRRNSRFANIADTIVIAADTKVRKNRQSQTVDRPFESLLSWF
jgi:two-component system chemotaxis response regulator CheB